MVCVCVWERKRTCCWTLMIIPDYCRHWGIEALPSVQWTWKVIERDEKSHREAADWIRGHPPEFLYSLDLWQEEACSLLFFWFNIIDCHHREWNQEEEEGVNTVQSGHIMDTQKNEEKKGKEEGGCPARRRKRLWATPHWFTDAVCQ